MRTMIVLLIATAITVLIEMWVCLGTGNGVKKFAKEV